MRIRVIPNAKIFSIEMTPAGIRVRLKSRPEKGAANKELLRELSRVTGARAHIAAGAKSRDKQVAFDGLSDEAALERMRIAGVAEPGQKSP